MIRSRSIPKSLQLSEMLIREIAAGHIPDGACLPPERALAAEHDVAVGTVRKALAVLEEKGLLERVQGSGNYVRLTGPVDSVYAFFRLELAHGGGLPTAIVLDAKKLKRRSDIPAMSDSAKAHRIRRLRLLDGIPVALEEIWLDGRFADLIAPDDLVDSLYLFYKESLGLIITRIEDRVGVGPLPDWQVPALDSGATFRPKAGTRVGYIERTSYDQAGDPAEFSRTWFDADRARYINRL